MKPITQALVIIVAAGIGLSLGFVLRQKSAVSPAEAVAKAPRGVNNVPDSAQRNQKSHGSTSVEDDSPLATQLARDLSMSTGVTRWLYWFDAIEQAHPVDYPRLVLLAEKHPNLLGMLAERWAKLYPRHLFDSLVKIAQRRLQLPDKVKNQLTRTLFQEWPKQDPHALVAAVNTVTNIGPLTHWRREAAALIVESDPELGLRLMSEWNVENYGPRMNGVAKWAAANPQHAAEFALAHPSGYATDMALETIGKEWARTDPARALEFATGKPAYNKLAAAALKEWAGKDLIAAANWLVSADARTRQRLSPPFVESWAQRDAVAALEWTEANLSGSTLAQAVGGVMRGAAQKDLPKAAQLVADLKPSPARAEAAVAVARKWFPGLTDSRLAAPDAIAWLTKLDSQSMRKVLDEISWQWASSDPQSMATFLNSRSYDEVAEHSHSTLARMLARKNPAAALAWADQLPKDRALSTGTVAFSEWSSSQPEAAMNWWRELPANDARRQPFFENAIRSMTYDSEAAARLAGLAPADRTAARNVISAMTLPPERRSLLLNALDPR